MLKLHDPDVQPLDGVWYVMIIDVFSFHPKHKFHHDNKMSDDVTEWMQPQPSRIRIHNENNCSFCLLIIQVLSSILFAL